MTGLAYATEVEAPVMFGAATITLPKGQIVLIDQEDLALVQTYRWQACRNRTGLVYAIGNPLDTPGAKRIMMHRLLLDPPKSHDVDHRDRNGLNNRRANLRIATRSQNNGNQRLSSRSKSGYRGVSWDVGCGKWRAMISLNDKRRYLGVFTDPWDAAQAWNAAAIAQWGEFARLNERIGE